MTQVTRLEISFGTKTAGGKGRGIRDREKEREIFTARGAEPSEAAILTLSRPPVQLLEAAPNLLVGFGLI